MKTGLFTKLFAIFSMFGSSPNSPSGGVILEKMSFGETVGLFFKSFFKNLFENVLTVIWQLFFAIGKLILNIVDFFAIVIKELAGQNGIEELTNMTKLTETDMVFRFIFDSNIWRVFIAFVGLAILLLIVFSIVAMIKTEYESFLGGQEDNSKKQVLKNSLAGLFMIFIVPFLAFGGIILSNATLSSVNRALGRSNGTFNIGSEIFIASTYEANAYRKYAMEDKRIPMLFNFERVTPNTVPLPAPTGSNQSMTEAMNEYLKKSVWQRGFSTWWLFYTGNFFSFDEIDEAADVLGAENNFVTWESFYDTGMQINKSEYYVLADLTDYMIRTGKVLRIVSAHDLALQDGVKIVEGSGLTENNIAYKETTLPSPRLFATVDESDNVVYYFDISYTENPAYGVTNVGDNGKVSYYFTPTNDEKLGAKFLVCTTSEKVVENTVTTYYTPLTNHTEKQNTISSNFYSNYLKFSELVLARGAFSQDGFPTAIRKVNGNIQFYRDAVSAPSLVDLLPVITYEKMDDKENIINGGFRWLLEDATGLDLDDFLPNIYFRDSAWTFFTKYETVETRLVGSEFYLNFNFSGPIKMQSVFSMLDVNLVILLFSSIILFSVLWKAIFGLIGRIFDLVLLFITFPAFASTIPIDDSARFKKWTKNFIGRIFAAYGIVIGINIVFLLLPIINRIEFFTIEFVTKNLRISGLMSAGQFCMMINFFVKMLFSLVLFTFLKTGATTVAELIGYGYNVSDSGEAVLGDVKKIVNKTADLFSGKFVVDKAKNLAGDIKGFIPGSAMAGRLIQSKKEHKDKKIMKKDIKASKNALLSGDETAIRADLEKGKNKKK